MTTHLLWMDSATGKMLENDLRFTMTEQRLNNLLLLHTHKEETDALELVEIANSFVSTNERQFEFLGKFLY